MKEQADAGALVGAGGIGVIDSAGDDGASERTARQHLMISMLEAVGAEGYERASVAAVVKRAGSHRQGFYDNFENAEDCYLQALDFGIARLEAEVVAAARRRGGWRPQLRAGLATLLARIEADPDYCRGLIVGVHAAGPEAMAKRIAAMRRVQDFLDRAREELGPDAQAPAPIAAEGVAAGIHAVIHSRLANGEGDGFRTLLPELMYVAVLPFFGARAAAEEMQTAKMV